MKVLPILALAICGIVGIGVSTAEAHRKGEIANVPTEAATRNDTAPNVAGKWQISWTDRNGNPKQATLQIQQDGSKLTGDFTSERGNFPLTGSLQGSQVSLTVKAKRRKASFTGTVDGESMKGSTEQGKTWTAVRQ
jgi:hypothetical protein